MGLDPSKVSLEDLTIADLDDVLENLSDFSGIASDEIEISEEALEDILEDPLLVSGPIQADDAAENDFGLSCLSDLPGQDEQAPRVPGNSEVASDFDISGIQDSALAHLLDSEVAAIPQNLPAEFKEQKTDKEGHSGLDSLDDLSGLAEMVFTPIMQQQQPRQDPASDEVDAQHDSLSDSELERCLNL